MKVKTYTSIVSATPKLFCRTMAFNFNLFPANINFRRPHLVDEFQLVFCLESPVDIKVADFVASVIANMPAKTDANPYPYGLFPNFKVEEPRPPQATPLLASFRVGRFLLLQVKDLEQFSRFFTLWYLFDSTFDAQLCPEKRAKALAEAPEVLNRHFEIIKNTPDMFYFLVSQFRGCFVGGFIFRHFYPFAEFGEVIENLKQRKYAGEPLFSDQIRGPEFITTGPKHEDIFNEYDKRDFIGHDFILDSPTYDIIYYVLKRNLYSSAFKLLDD